MGKVTKPDLGITCCVNCIGMHPDEPITAVTVMSRIKDPAKVVHKQLMSFEKKRKEGLYNNKSCMLCGRTYDAQGNLDESWDLTAKRVKAEFDSAGVYGVDDAMVKEVVASCVKSWKMLWKNRATILPADMEKMTFAGRLALIITHAQEAREKKIKLGGNKKGLIV